MVRRIGTLNADVLDGTSSYDWLFGAAGDDQLFGLAGNDYLVGGAGNNRLIGGDGNDVLFANYAFTLSRAQPNLGVELVVGSDFTVALSTMQGGAGNDILIGYGQIDGGAGNDTLIGGNGFGGGVTGGAGNDLFVNTDGEAGGGLGDDTFIFTESGSFSSVGGTGRNRIVVDGNFTGDLSLGTLDADDIIEFHNVTGLTSVAAVAARETTGSFGLYEITVDADTTISFFADFYFDPDTGDPVTGKPSYEFNRTSVDSIIGGINAQIAEARDARVSTLSGGNETFTGTSVKDIVSAGNGNDNVGGGGGNDDLRGQAGADTLAGSYGNDTLAGGAGRDVLIGGAGRDIFDYDSLAETGKLDATRDVIRDFVHLSDRIDLSTIDANGALAGNGTFSFQPTKGAAFTGLAGQLHYFQSGGNTFVEGDINGDRVADFQIRLNGSITLSSEDFIL